MQIESANASRGEELSTAVVKGLLSAVPLAGGLVAEIAALYFDPLKKRNERWVLAVTDALNELHTRASRGPEELAKDERFLSMLYHATSIAWKNHQEQKINLLKAGLVSAGTNPDISDDRCFQYLRLVDELTVSHVRLLQEFWLHAEQISACTGLEAIHSLICPVDNNWLSREQFRVLVEDLQTRFLVHRGDIEDFPEFESRGDYVEPIRMKTFRVTEFGCQFLSFVETQ